MLYSMRSDKPIGSILSVCRKMTHEFLGCNCCSELCTHEFGNPLHRCVRRGVGYLVVSPDRSTRPSPGFVISSGARLTHSIAWPSVVFGAKAVPLLLWPDISIFADVAIS
jgi:hypothetical protein